MLAGVLAVLNMIPGLSTLITTLASAYFNSKVQLTSARIGADAAVTQAMLTAVGTEETTRVDALKVRGSSWILSSLVVGFAAPWIAYEWKVVIWDAMLGWRSTPAVHGAVGDWATTIIGCLFGSGTVLAAGHMWFNRSK